MRSLSYWRCSPHLVSLGGALLTLLVSLPASADPPGVIGCAAGVPGNPSQTPTIRILQAARQPGRSILIGHGAPGNVFMGDLGPRPVFDSRAPIEFARQVKTPTMQFQCYSASSTANSLSTIERAVLASGQRQIGFMQPVFMSGGGTSAAPVIEIGLRPVANGLNMAVEAIPIETLPNGEVIYELRAMSGERAIADVFGNGNVKWGGVRPPGAPTAGAPGTPGPNGQTYGVPRGMGYRVAMVGGQLVFLVGTEVLMHYAGEYAEQADIIHNASRNDCGCPFNADAATPYMVWSADYWQQVGWYYGACDDQPPDPKWFGSNPLPRPGSKDYDAALDRAILDQWGRDSFTWFIRSNRLDPTPIGYDESLEIVPVYDPFGPFNLRDPFRLRRFDDPKFDLRVRRTPVYGPRGWRDRFDTVDPACENRRGGAIRTPGVDPPFEGDDDGEPGEVRSCACAVPGARDDSPWIGAAALCAFGFAFAARGARRKKQPARKGAVGKDSSSVEKSS